MKSLEQLALIIAIRRVFCDPDGSTDEVVVKSCKYTPLIELLKLFCQHLSDELLSEMLGEQELRIKRYMKQELVWILTNVQASLDMCDDREVFLRLYYEEALDITKRTFASPIDFLASLFSPESSF